MDPISAAGIGLSVASLALQLFSGCIKGYQIFIECIDMPAEYEHLRTRLRIEQARFLHWGQILGLVEESIDQPSPVFSLNQSLIIDIEQQVQIAFRAALKTTSKFDAYVQVGPSQRPAVRSSSPMTKTASTFLEKTLRYWEKGGRVVGRLEWVMIKRGGFEKLLSLIIEWNDKAATVLDQTTLSELRKVQTRSNLILLQLTDDIGALRELILATKVQSASKIDSVSLPSESGSELDMLESLALFKRLDVETQDSVIARQTVIAYADLQLPDRKLRRGRQYGHWHARRVWLEWRDDSLPDSNLGAEFHEAVRQRVRKLTVLLSAQAIPQGFCAPQCIGHVEVEEHSGMSMALVFAVPDEHESARDLVSLRELLGSLRGVSLDQRVKLAQTLTEALLSLHAVNWMHKGICSANILFSRAADDYALLNRPFLAGFETARAALPDELTVPHLSLVERDLYRHPTLLHSPTRFIRSYDIYSLGLVLAELALWTPIETIARLPEVRRKTLSQLLPNLLDREHFVFEQIADRTGWKFADVVHTCLTFDTKVGLDDEASPAAKARFTRAFHQDIVLQLKGIAV